MSDNNVCLNVTVTVTVNPDDDNNVTCIFLNVLCIIFFQICTVYHDACFFGSGRVHLRVGHRETSQMAQSHAVSFILCSQLG